MQSHFQRRQQTRRWLFYVWIALSISDLFRTADELRDEKGAAIMNDSIWFESRGSLTDVYVPYCFDFISALKQSLGFRKYDPDKTCWTVRTTDLPTVKSIIRKVFSWSETENGFCRVRFVFFEDCSRCKEPIRFGPYILAQASGVNSGAKTGSNVRVIKGLIGSGGTAQYWESRITAGTILEAEIPERLLEESGVYIFDVYGLPAANIIRISDGQQGHDLTEGEPSFERSLAFQT